MPELDTIRSMYQPGIAAMLSSTEIVPGAPAALFSGGRR